MQADKVILWLAEEQFPNKEKDLPQQLLDLIPKGLTIEWCEDIKSYKKLIPAIKKYPESIIVTADDDILYKDNWLEQLYSAYVQEPEYIHCHRAHYIMFEQDNLLPYKEWVRNASKIKPSFNNFCTSGGGALYPPNCFYKDILKEDLFMQLCPQADDIWLWAMCVLNNKKINIVTGGQRLNLIDGTQETALWYSNVNEGQNDVQLNNLIKHYPELLDKLDKNTKLSDIIGMNISILVPVYNVEKYLPRCLNSVLGQKFNGTFEVICVNDGSTDNSGKILEEYAQRYPNMKIINQENQGLAAARYSAINVAQGEYIGFVDSDDYVDKDYFQKLYKAAKEQDADIATTPKVYMVGANHRISIKDCGIKSDAKIINTKEDKSEIIITTGICWNKIYRKEFLDKYDICHFGNAPGTDNFFTTCSVIRANKIAVIHNSAYYYMMRENSITHVLKGKKEFGIFENYASIDKWINNQTDFSVYDKQYWKFINNKRKQRDFEVFYRTMKPEYLNEFKSEAKENLKLDNLIISLTSYPERINTVNQAVESLLNQSIQAEKVILWLAEEQFPNKEKDLPQQLLDLIPKGLTIEWCEDIKSYKKLIPAIKKYPESIIATADDDILYKNNWLEQLYSAYIQEPDYIHCQRAHYITFEQDEISPYQNWEHETLKKTPSYNNFFTGAGGILYHPNCFYKDILKEDLFMQLCPQADDIWFWAMCVLNNKKINIATDNPILNVINGTQKTALWYSNMNNGQNDVQLNNLIKHYPELLEKLDKKKKIADFKGIAVSIVIPVYNVEKYLKRCINSIVKQNFPEDKFEIICVDDGSTDSSLQILREFENQYKNIKVMTLVKSDGISKGPGEARNLGLANARGKYILFIDSDDFIVPDTLNMLYDYAEENNSDLVVFDFLKAKAGVLHPEVHHYDNIAEKYWNKQFNADTAETFVYRFLPVAPWGKFYLRELIKDFKFIKDIYYQDVPFWDLVFLNAKRINYMPHPLYYYDFSRDNNITSTKNRKVFDVFKSFNASRENLKKYGYYEKYKYIMYAHATCNMIHHFSNISEDLRKDFIDEIKNFERIKRRKSNRINSRCIENSC